MLSASERSARDWFAIQVYSGRERLSAMHLRSRGYEVFLPCCRVRRRWSDRVKEIEQALFTGYLFCRISGDISSLIVSTPGVIRIVSDGQRPLPIPPREIEALQRAVATGLHMEPWRFLQPGQHVRIIDGPLRGTEGTVVKNGIRDRLILTVSILRRAVAVEIDPEWVSIPPALHAPIAG